MTLSLIFSFLCTYTHAHARTPLARTPIANGRDITAMRLPFAKLRASEVNSRAKKRRKENGGKKKDLADAHACDKARRARFTANMHAFVRRGTKVPPRPRGASDTPRARYPASTTPWSIRWISRAGEAGRSDAFDIIYNGRRREEHRGTGLQSHRRRDTRGAGTGWKPMARGRSQSSILLTENPVYARVLSLFLSLSLSWVRR